MGMSWDEAVAAVTGPEGPFAITDGEVNGQKVKVFGRTPPSLRVLWSLARARGDLEYLVYEDERWSFADLADRIDAIAALLVERYGVGRGDRVAIAMRNYPEWIAAFGAITSIGAVSVSMNAWWTEDELAYGLEDSGSKVMIADVDRIERVAARLDDLGVRTVAVRSQGPLPASFPASVERLDDVWELGAPLPEVEVGPDDDATILYTSGTTGRPKGAVSTQRAVLSALVAFGCRVAINGAMNPGEAAEAPERACYLLSVPLFHVTGCVPVMLGSFAGGHKLVMMYKWSPERALELIERERISVFVGVPTMAWDLLESPDFERRDTSSLRNVGGGGAPAPPELVRRVDARFAKGRPGIGYGMTETNAYGPQNSGDDYVRKPESAGRAVPIVELRVTDAEGEPLGPGEVGEIWFRGPHLIRGYWNRPEATAETIVDGWLRSGDIGRIDEEGFIFVQDRAKDMVLRGGENVYCAEVEAVIYEHPAVHEAAVFGLPHDRLGEEVAVAIFPKSGVSLDAADLQRHVGAKLASFKVPSHVEVTGEPLPRNASGKILKRTIRDEIAARR